MSLRASAGTPLRVLGLFVTVFLVLGSAAFAQVGAILSGTVTAGGRPAAGADVTATGSNLTLHTRTDARGSFRFSGLPIGTYTLDVSGTEGRAMLRVDLPTAGATVTLSLSPLKKIGRTAVTARPPVHGSGTDLTLNNETLERSPGGGSLPNLLIQMPGAARGANGVVHLNGDHGDVNYIVDGVAIPQELNRTIGTEFDPNDIAFVEALQGAYAAQYGERFASVININTRTGSGPPGFDGGLEYGSYAELDQTLGYHAQIGRGNLVTAIRNERSDRGLDPPNFDSPHNNFSNTNQFLRYTLPSGPNFFNLTVSHSHQTYQIPNDVAGGEPASTDDNNTQDDLFGTLQFRHPIADHGAFTVGPYVKRSRLRDFPDPPNDFIYGEAQNPGLPTDCAQAFSPSVNYVNGSCAFSLFSDRTATDVGVNLDYENRSAKHDVGFGGLYDATQVKKLYDIALQPANFLGGLFGSLNPNGPYTVVDNAPNNGHLTAVYLQDSWRMGDKWELDYGVRANSFLVSSTEFDVGFGQISPRLKLTRFFGPRTGVYVYYGRFFTPFSLENVSPSAAFLLNLPLLRSPSVFDLKPQRDSVYEVGAHFPVGPGDLGIRVMQKNATDLIDDTQVGLTNLHQDINYAQGRIATQTAYYQLPLVNGGRFYASLTHTYSVNKGCETQLLAPCFGAPNDWTPADHDQRVDITSGVLLNDHRGGWFSLDGEYGSGLSSALNPNGGITCAGPDYSLNIGGPCKRTPHIVFNTEKGIAIGPRAAVTLRIMNIFNDRYFVTYLNAQGQHFAPPRTFSVGLRFVK